jgi:hypothetical protein
MGFLAKVAKWYLADIVEEIRVEGDRRNVVHTNLILVRADSPNEAYAELGFAQSKIRRFRSGTSASRLDYRSADMKRKVHERWPYRKGVRGTGHNKSKNGSK